MCVCQTDGRDVGIGMILLFLLPKAEKAFLLVDCSADLPRRVAGGIDGGAEGVFVQRLLREDHRLPPRPNVMVLCQVSLGCRPA